MRVRHQSRRLTSSQSTPPGAPPAMPLAALSHHPLFSSQTELVIPDLLRCCWRSDAYPNVASYFVLFVALVVRPRRHIWAARPCRGVRTSPGPPDETSETGKHDIGRHLSQPAEQT